MSHTIRVQRITLTGFIAAGSVIFLLWFALSRSLGHAALPDPIAVAGRLYHGGLKDLLPHLQISLRRVFLTLFFSVVIGVPIGILCGRVRIADRILAPFIFLLYPVPKIALLPVLLILLGIGDLSKITLTSIIVGFHFVTVVRDAARSIEQRLIHSMILLGATPFQRLVHVIIPACLPKIFSVLRVGLGTAIALIFLIETYATEWGIGLAIMDAFARYDYIDVFSGVVALSVVGFVLYYIIECAERRLCRWMSVEAIA